MLRSAGLSIILITVGLVATSQTKFHMKAGFTIAHLLDEFDPQKQARMGFYGGFAGTIPFNKTLYLQPELLYSLRGYRFPATQLNSSGTVSQNYVSLPILLGYAATNKWKFLIGPEPGYLAWAKSRYDGSTHNVTKDINYRFNLDATGGINYVVAEGFEIETRFCFGLTPQYKGQLTDNLGNVTGYAKTGYHRVLEVGVKYELTK